MTKLAIAHMNLRAAVARLMAHEARPANTLGETFRVVGGGLVHLSYSAFDWQVTRNDMEDTVAECRAELETAEAAERAEDLATLASLRGFDADTTLRGFKVNETGASKARATFRAMGVM